ncbi:MAG TPA: DUF4132 domain-containing protein [Kofleriaceae bacterium]|nr:DUF4132 domain-containing protein [Kofleriaceae bacterium]
MQPRVEAGRITEMEYVFGVLELESGKTLRFELPWDQGFQVGWRVLVTFGAKGQVVRVGLDLSPIGMTEVDASSLDKVQARFDEMIAQGPLTTEQRELFGAVIESHRHSMGKEARKLRDRIERALAGDTLPLTDDDPWAAAARGELATIGERAAWLELLALDGSGAKPTKKWLATATALVQRIGVRAFADTVRRWFALVSARPVVRDEDSWFTPAMGDTNSDALKNLVWACGTIDDPQASEPLAVALGDLAVRCFTKIPGVGALSTKAGNACIHVLSQLPGMRAVAQLSRLGSRVRYRQALALVDKAKLECARRAGVSAIDLEELSLPAFGLDVEGRARVELGEHVAELAIVEDKVTLTFFEGDKRLKSVPAAVKSAHAEALAELKTTHKELAALVPTVRARLERWMFEPRTWPLADLRARYLDHPLVARLARRVIYAIGEHASVIFFDGRPLDRAGKEIALGDDAQLSLWHPLGRPADEIAEWRSFLASLDVTQPFKQVDRELYLPGDERDAHEASRFSGRIVRQHALAALLRERGWSYSLMGTFDGGNVPTKQLAAYDLTVELDVDVPAEAQVGDSGIYLHVLTGGVRFHRDRRTLRIADVPARCFSEVMRDVDLFVSGSRLH